MHIRNDMHHMTVFFHCHEIADFYAPKLCGSPNVIPRQVDEHQMLRALLRITEQICRILVVFRGVHPPTPSPRDRPNVNPPINRPHMNFR